MHKHEYLLGFRPKPQSSDWFRQSLRTMKQNGNFRSNALFYNYYNIYLNIVFDLTSTINNR